EMAGYYSQPFVREQFTVDYDGDFIGTGTATSAAPAYFNHRKTSIYGGSNEVQKNIICKFVLGL
ncbi:MAG: pimeloyl-CoA dehydrogenase large subunit, partial [Pseudomonadales bacterium]